MRKANRRPLNLESILKMGESELEDEESSDTQRLHGFANGKSKFELLTAGSRQRPHHHDADDDDIDDGPSTSAAAAAALQQRNATRHHHQQQQQQHHHHVVDDDDDDDDDIDDDDHHGDNGDSDNDDDDDNDSNKATDCNRKVVTKLTARTKMFLNSVLRFKRNLKRRQSSSCSDLFVI